MATQLQASHLKQLPGTGRRLVEEGLIAEDQAMEALAKAAESGRSFTSHLVRENLIDSVEFAHIAAEEFGLPVIDLNAMDMRQAPQDIIKEDLMRKHLVVPLMKRDKRLFVAIADPANQSALDEIAFTTGLNVEASVWRLIDRWTAPHRRSRN